MEKDLTTNDKLGKLFEELVALVSKMATEKNTGYNISDIPAIVNTILILKAYKPSN